MASTDAAHGPILVIDDDPDIREAVAELLRHHGREVIVAHNGRDALLKLTPSVPCLILLDLMMPVMDGFQFLDQLASMASDIPVLVLSAHDAVHPGERYPHVLGTLQKPFDGPELLSALDEHC